MQAYYLRCCRPFLSTTYLFQTNKRMSQYITSMDVPTATAYAAIEEVVQRDEGNRGIKFLCIPNELYHASDALIKANKVAIITGFPCMLDHSPPTETDGPLGALAIARACLYAGQEVVLMTDECNEEVVLSAAAASDLFAYNDITSSSSTSNNENHEQADDGNDADIFDTSHRRFSLESFPPQPNFDENDLHRLQSIMSDVDMVVAIERTGPSIDGTYRTMRKRDMTNIVAPLDIILDASKGFPAVRSIGIGDGGNEVGMGKVYHSITDDSISTIPNAKDIACVRATEFLLVASVSNWGGYALSAALSLRIFERDRLMNPELKLLDILDGCLPSRHMETTICQRMIDSGARDGITGQCELMVDGMPLETSLNIIDEIKAKASRITCSTTM